jgi:DsbC/DsbD-like thiol-disulfide interchange protein
VCAPRIAALIPIAGLLAIGIGAAQSSDEARSPGKDSPPRTAVVSAETKHLAVRATLSEVEVTPGARISLAIDITPKPGMHVYAPGSKYTPVTIQIQPQPFVDAHETVYPPAEDYFFAPLNEHAQVYSRPFRLVRDITIGAGSEPKKPASLPSRITLKGTLDYQACDDKFCYVRTSVPLQWTVKIKR